MNKKIKFFIISIGIVLFIILGIILLFYIVNARKPHEIYLLSCEFDVRGVSMKIKENTLTESGMVLMFSSNDDFSYTSSSGDDYKLYYLKNGKWIELPREGKEWNATEMTLTYPPTKLLEENIKWSRKYGPLHKKGRYKLEQQGISINGIGGKYTIEFKIQ